MDEPTSGVAYPTLRLQAALALARRGHAVQCRRFSHEPYVYHPIRVAQSVREALNGQPIAEDAECAALLHDTLEDTEVTPSEIEAACGPGVLAMVRLLTKDKPADESSAQRYIARLASAPDAVKLIKLLDRMDNLSDLDSQCQDDAFIRRYARGTRRLLAAIGQAWPAVAARLEILLSQLEARDAVSRLEARGARRP
jgi:guanosine-3',5'-bis(diphosphate) 3'-pyrophosphohydrolase